MRVSERVFFTARFAKDAESAKGNDFSIAVDPRAIGFALHGAGRTAMENYSAALEFGSERVI
jgi:hypothetical protein